MKRNSNLFLLPILILMGLSVTGCETTKTVDAYCSRAGLIYWHIEDTPGTKRQVAAHNETFEGKCL